MLSQKHRSDECKVCILLHGLIVWNSLLIVLFQITIYTCYQTNCHFTAILTWSGSDVKIQQSFIMPFTNKLWGKWDGAIIQYLSLSIYTFETTFTGRNTNWDALKSLNITPKVCSGLQCVCCLLSSWMGFF